mmetsp:Transcript_10166/g.15892  ORF Transcript_10166/g.15892 Transcript_10166/m.15892 type:complete len:313 (-) Transcript_10166:2557-3495(-)
MENYKRTEILGQGAYGKVYKGQDLRSGETVALKRALTTNEDEGIPPTTLREISILRAVSECEYIVKLLDIVKARTKTGRFVLYIVFQFLDSDLKAFMNKNYGKGNKIEFNLSKELIFQLLMGIQFCHDQGIMHRDLKPQNLLIQKGKRLKIGDFGLSRNYNIPIGRYTHEVVTLWYRAPEILLGAKCYSTPIDVWSIGCIFAEMITGKPLFCGESELEQLLGIFKILGTPTYKIWPGLGEFRDWHDFPNWSPQNLDNVFPNFDKQGKNLIQGMLRLDPNERVTVKTAINCPFFDNIRNLYSSTKYNSLNIEN